MDPITRDRDGIIHINLEDFLLNKRKFLHKRTIIVA